MVKYEDWSEKEDANDQRQTSKDLQKAQRITAQDHLKKLQVEQNIKQ